MHKAYYNTLKNILEENKNTEFGKTYNFSQINTFEEYKKKYLFQIIPILSHISIKCIMAKLIF